MHFSCKSTGPKVSISICGGLSSIYYVIKVFCFFYLLCLESTCFPLTALIWVLRYTELNRVLTESRTRQFFNILKWVLTHTRTHTHTHTHTHIHFLKQLLGLYLSLLYRHGITHAHMVSQTIPFILFISVMRPLDSSWRQMWFNIKYQWLRQH